MSGAAIAIIVLITAGILVVRFLIHTGVSKGFDVVSNAMAKRKNEQNPTTKTKLSDTYNQREK